MIKNVITVSQYDRLEDAIYLMMKHHVGVLPVVDNEQVYGIITDKDVFKAFLEISGYGEEGVRVEILAEDTVGILAKVIDTIAERNLNIKRTIIATRQSGKVAVEVQIDGKTDIENLKNKLIKRGIDVKAVEKTVAKSLD